MYILYQIVKHCFSTNLLIAINNLKKITLKFQSLLQNKMNPDKLIHYHQFLRT